MTGSAPELDDRPGAAHRWTVRAIGALLVWLGLWGLAVLGDGDVRPVLLGAAVLAGTAILAAASELTGATEPADWSPVHVPAAALAGNDPRFSRLSRLLSEASDRALVGDELHRTLRRLTDDRLAPRGVDRRSQPEQARVLLGDDLFDYLAAPPRGRRANETSHLTGLITRIEEL